MGAAAAVVAVAPMFYALSLFPFYSVNCESTALPGARLAASSHNSDHVYRTGSSTSIPTHHTACSTSIDTSLSAMAIK